MMATSCLGIELLLYKISVYNVSTILPFKGQVNCSYKHCFLTIILKCQGKCLTEWPMVAAAEVMAVIDWAEGKIKAAQVGGTTTTKGRDS